MSFNEWKIVKIEDICSIKRGASPRPIQEYIRDSGIPWVKIADATSSESRFIERTKEFIKEEGKSKSRYIEQGTLILSNSATPGIPKIMKINACVHDGWLIVDDYQGVTKEYMYYMFVIEREKLLMLSNGSVFNNLKTDIVKNYEITLPPLEEQKAIANILSSLDEKIEVNNQINKKLEEMAQVIFKQWFVDYEFPNEEGMPYKSSGGAMFESELGMIPKGWEVIEIGDFITVADGTHASPKKQKEGYPLITSKHIKNNKLLIEEAKLISEKDFVEVNKRSKVDTRDILITMIGTVGVLYYVSEKEISFAIKNLGLFKTSENANYANYIYLYLSSNKMKDYIKSRLAGSTQQYISLTELRKIPLFISNQEVNFKFNELVEPLFQLMSEIKEQNQRLKGIRDALLPKLMSGEIRVLIDKE